jgi:hypothetical protein
MDTTCPICRSAIAIDDVNVATDMALCRRCGKTFSFSELVQGSSIGAADLKSPPNGAWFEQLADGFRAGASTRSWMAVFLVPFTCVWSGMSLSGLYGKQIVAGKFDPGTSFFGLPFLIGSVVLIASCAMMIAGKIEVLRRGDQLSVFTGVGMLGWTRTYSWSDFSAAREESGRNGFNWNQRNAAIVLEGKRRAAFGVMLNEERRYFLLSAVRQALHYSTLASTGFARSR